MLCELELLFLDLSFVFLNVCEKVSPSCGYISKMNLYFLVIHCLIIYFFPFPGEEPHSYFPLLLWALSPCLSSPGEVQSTGFSGGKNLTTKNSPNVCLLLVYHVYARRLIPFTLNFSGYFILPICLRGMGCGTTWSRVYGKNLAWELNRLGFYTFHKWPHKPFERRRKKKKKECHR